MNDVFEWRLEGIDLARLFSGKRRCACVFNGNLVSFIFGTRWILPTWTSTGDNTTKEVILSEDDIFQYFVSSTTEVEFINFDLTVFNKNAKQEELFFAARFGATYDYSDHNMQVEVSGVFAIITSLRVSGCSQDLSNSDFDLSNFIESFDIINKENQPFREGSVEQNAATLQFLLLVIILETWLST